MRKALNHVYLHFVWATWDHLPLWSPDRKRQAYALILAACARLEIPVIAIGGTENHVHLFVRHSAALSICELVKQIKGSSAHALNRGGSDGWFKWQGSYGNFSVSPHDVPMIENYVIHQEHIHAERMCKPEYELDE